MLEPKNDDFVYGPYSYDSSDQEKDITDKKV